MKINKKSKKIISIFTLMCLILAITPLTFSIPAEVQNRIQERKELIREQKELDMEARLQLRERKLEERLFIRGERLQFDVPPVIKEGRTLVPVRAISEGLDAEVTWDQDLKKITIVKGEDTIELFLDSITVMVNGVEKEIDVPAQMESNRTFVPIRFISEILGEKVVYDDETGDIDVGLDD